MEIVVGIGAVINLFILIWILSALGEIRKEARQTRQFSPSSTQILLWRNLIVQRLP